VPAGRLVAVGLAFQRADSPCSHPVEALSFYSGMEPFFNLDEVPGKVVGRRRPPSDTMSSSISRTPEDARAWAQALGGLRVRRGVYRFKTHDEADEWLWEKITKPSR
jgi:hypothetical protein